MEKNFQFKKKFGQNFISDTNLLKRIVDESEVQEDSLILEIGPGSGNLTAELLKTNNKVICFEIDKELKPILEKRFNGQKIEIYFADFLNKDVKSILANETYQNLYLISNLPYYITTPIIEKIIDDKIEVKQMTLMVQKEVADRFSAKPGCKSYNSLTIYLNYYFEIKKLFDVPRTLFYPVPNVDSAIVKFVRKENKEVLKDEKIFFKLVRDAFQFKRKNLRNNLKDYDLVKIAEILNKYNLDLTARAEEIDMKLFVEIANNI